MSLSELKKGDSAIIENFNNSAYVVKKLNSVGLIRGASVKFIRRAPFLGPIEIKVLDYYLAVRLEDAKKIKVKKI